MFKSGIGPEANNWPSKNGALLCLSSDHVGSCLLEIKYSCVNMGLALGVTWLGPISKIAPMRSTNSSRMMQKELVLTPSENRPCSMHHLRLQ
jgi:hypothetical protein